MTSEDRTFFKVMSKAKNSELWQAERTVGVESYAKDMVKAIEKAGRMGKIIRV